MSDIVESLESLNMDDTFNDYVSTIRPFDGIYCTDPNSYSKLNTNQKLLVTFKERFIYWICLSRKIFNLFLKLKILKN